MTADFKDVLDRAVQHQLRGESGWTIPGHNPAQHEVLEELLNTAALLRALEPVEMPAPELMLADRHKFLHHLQTMLPPPAPAGPAGLLARLYGWAIHHLSWQLPNLIGQRKGYRPMSTLAIKLILVFGVVFASVGGTAVMAAESLPDSPLYPLKLSLEQAQLAVADGPAEQAALHLVFAQKRLGEVRQLAAPAKAADEATMNRTLHQLEQHFRLALQLAARAPDEALGGLLVQTREMVQTQLQLQLQAQSRADQPARSALQQATRLLNQVGQDVEDGYQNRQGFRWRHLNGPGEPGGNGDKPPCQGLDCEQTRERVRERTRDGDCDPDCEQNREQKQEQNQGQSAPCSQDPDCVREQTRQQIRQQQQAQQGCNGNPDCTGDQHQQRDQTRKQTQTGDCSQNSTCIENRERTRDRGQDGDTTGLDQLATPDQDQDQDQLRNRGEDCDPDCDGEPDRDQDRQRDGQTAPDQAETLDQDQDQTQNRTQECDPDCDGEQDQTQEQAQDGTGDGTPDQDRDRIGQDDEPDQDQASDSSSDSAPTTGGSNGSDDDNAGQDSDHGSGDDGSTSSDSGSSNSGDSDSGSGSGKNGK